MRLNTSNAQTNARNLTRTSLITSLQSSQTSYNTSTSRHRRRRRRQSSPRRHLRRNSSTNIKNNSLNSLLHLSIRKNRIISTKRRTHRVTNTNQVLSSIRTTHSTNRLISININNMSSQILATTNIRSTNRTRFNTKNIRSITKGTTIFNLLISQKIQQDTINTNIVKYAMTSNSNKTSSRASNINSIASSRRLTINQPQTISRPIVIRILSLHHIRTNRRMQQNISTRILMTMDNMFHKALNLSRFDNILRRHLISTNLTINVNQFNKYSGRIHTMHARLLIRLLQRNRTSRHRTRRYNHTSRQHRRNRRHTQAPTRRNTRRRSRRRANINRQFPPSAPA